ncbi:hypothetical protein [Serratia rubidaea]|uniref:hypothetical protein n=1 Tax=Serratia rubidaea TaxID=61652 RepID=UPI00242F71D8|nr:hypothetical protein [Serratia rubidaea]MCR0998687.1 hypothetical protein [Serratia rubidaea]
MATQISMQQLKSIYAQHGADVPDHEIQEILEFCNENADALFHDRNGNPLPTRTALEWANWFAEVDYEGQCVVELTNSNLTLRGAGFARHQ